jgi:hypothetical protein
MHTNTTHRAETRSISIAAPPPAVPGSEYLFTLVFPDGTPEIAISRQMAAVEDELVAVRALCEAEAGGTS